MKGQNLPEPIKFSVITDALTSDEGTVPPESINYAHRTLSSMSSKQLVDDPSDILDMKNKNDLTNSYLLSGSTRVPADALDDLQKMHVEYLFARTGFGGSSAKEGKKFREYSKYNTSLPTLFFLTQAQHQKLPSLLVKLSGTENSDDLRKSELQKIGKACWLLSEIASPWCFGWGTSRLWGNVWEYNDLSTPLIGLMHLNHVNEHQQNEILRPLNQPGAASSVILSKDPPQVSKSTNSRKSQSLDTNHSHFILLADAPDGGGGHDRKRRDSTATLIKYFAEHYQLPAVQLVVGGHWRTFSNICKFAEAGFPVQTFSNSSQLN
jgi:hypothetical protein